jgi:hypothetical protein
VCVHDLALGVISDSVRNFGRVCAAKAKRVFSVAVPTSLEPQSSEGNSWPI